MADAQTFLSQFGMPTETPEQIQDRYERVREQERLQSEANEMGLAANAGMSKAWMRGAMIGSTRRKRQAREKATAEAQQSPEYKMTQLSDSVRTSMEKRMAQPDWATLSPGQQKNEYLKSVAQEAQKAGMPQVASNAASQYASSIVAMKKAEVEQRKLSAEATVKEAKAGNIDTEIRNDNAKARRDAIDGQKAAQLHVWPKGDPNGQAQLVMMQPNGEWLGADGTVVSKEDFIDLDPEDQNLVAAGTAKDKADLVRAYASPTQQSAHRTAHTNLVSQARVADSMLNIIENASYQINGSEDTLTGPGGKIAADTVDFVKTVSNSFRNIGAYFNDNQSILEGSGGLDAATTSMAKVRERAMETLKNASGGKVFEEGHGQFESAMWKMTYAMARVFEPNAKQLSEGDIERAAAVVGANLTNPEALRHVIATNIRQANSDFDSAMMTYPDQIGDLLIAEGARDQRMQVVGDLVTRLDAYGQGAAGDTRYGGGGRPVEGRAPATQRTTMTGQAAQRAAGTSPAAAPPMTTNARREAELNSRADALFGN